jgi:hypothetical protein
MADLKLTFLNGKLSEEQLKNAEKVIKAAKAAGVDPALAVSVAFKEGSLLSSPTDSEDGAIGMMQVMPKTGKAYGYSEEDLRKPEINLIAGLKNLKESLAYAENNPKLAAVYYHSGPDAIADLAAGKPMGARAKEYVRALKGFGTFEAFNPEAQITSEEPAPEAAKPPVNVNEPTPSQLAQMKLEKEMAEARETAAEQKPLGALYGGGAGLAGAVVKDARDAKQGLGRVTQSLAQLSQQMGQQAPQTGATGAPMGGGVPTQPQTGGLPSGTDAQTTRILQGTTGDQGTTGRARQTGYNVETSQQAAAKARAQSIIDSLRQSGQVVEDAPTFFAQQPGMTSTPSGVLAPRSDLPQYVGARGPQGEIGGAKPPVPVVPKMSGLDATKALFVDMMKSTKNVSPTMEEYKGLASNVGRSLGRLPYISGPLAGASIGMEIPELDYGMRVSQPDYTDIGLTGAGILGTAGSFFPPVAPLAIPLSIGAPMIRDIRRQKQEIQRNPAEYRDTIMRSLSNTDPMGNPIP